MKVINLFLFLSASFFLGNNWSLACSSPSGAEGEMKMISGVLYYCTNTGWILTRNTDNATACTTAGTIYHSGGQIAYCNGNTMTWFRMDKATSLGACVVGDSGKFYYNTTSKFYNYCNGSAWRNL